MFNSAFRKIERYLYDFNYIETKINTIQSHKSEEEYDQSYTKYIKNKSSSLEDQVIKNIGLEQRILKIRKWQSLIKTILTEYKETDNLKYSFIVLKYFNKKNPIVIENKLNISIKEQKDIQAEILQYIFLLAIQKNMLVREVNL